MKEWHLKSFDDTPIYVTLWDDVKNPKGVILISHGMNEYAKRYDRFAKFMNSNDYIVFADDHRAYGRTEDDKNRGNHKGNIFEKTLFDMLFFYNYLKDKYSLPVFYLGHSYGSFIGQAFLQENTGCKAVALLGTTYFSAKAKVGICLFSPWWLVARNWRPTLTKIMNDKFFTFKGDSGPSQWLTRDLKKRQEYIDDKYCQVNSSVNFAFSTVWGLNKLYTKKARKKLHPTTAVGVFCGSDDYLGVFGKKSEKLVDFYQDSGINVEYKLYDGMRHEILNEIGYEKAQEDILKFFNKFIVYKQSTIDDIICSNED